MMLVNVAVTALLQTDAGSFVRYHENVTGPHENTAQMEALFPGIW